MNEQLTFEQNVKSFLIFLNFVNLPRNFPRLSRQLGCHILHDGMHTQLLGGRISNQIHRHSHQIRSSQDKRLDTPDRTNGKEVGNMERSEK